MRRGHFAQIAYQLMVFQIGGMARYARCGQIGRGGAGQQLAVGQLACNQIGIGQSADAQRDIHPLFDQINKAILQLQRHLDARKFRHEIGHQRPQKQGPKGNRRGDAQAAARRGLQVRGFAVSFLQIVEDTFAFNKVGTTGIGQVELARGALYQPYATWSSSAAR